MASIDLRKKCLPGINDINVSQSKNTSPTALTSLGKLSEMQILGPHLRLTESETLQYRCVLTSPSDDSTGLSSLKTTGLEEIMMFPKKAMET